MTSNIGSEVIREYTLGFTAGDKLGKVDDKEMRERVLEALQKSFRPEFLNRIDSIITFSSLKNEEIEKIVDLQLNLVKRRLEKKEIKLKFSDALRKYVAKEGFDPIYGARPLKRVIQNKILDPLALEIIDQKIKPGHTVSVDIKNGQLTFTTKS